MLLNSYYCNIQTFEHTNLKIKFQRKQINNSYTFQALQSFSLLTPFSQAYPQDLSFFPQDKADNPKITLAAFYNHLRSFQKILRILRETKNLLTSQPKYPIQMTGIFHSKIMVFSFTCKSLRCLFRVKWRSSTLTLVPLPARYLDSTAKDLFTNTNQMMLLLCLKPLSGFPLHSE